MKIRRNVMSWGILLALLIGFCFTAEGYGDTKKASVKKRILVVDSYNREYAWSAGTNEGFCAAMLKFGYFDNKDQAAEYTKKDYVETSKAVVKKLWMDAKRKSSKGEKANSTLKITKIAKDFKPDLIFLGDDDAAEYVGNQFLDSKLPIVFWGINNSPVKYGLVDRIDKPGHNVTGVYQSGFYVESLKLLKKIAPNVKTFATLSDGTSAGRLHYKEIEYLDRKGALPLKLVETISTNDFELWKEKALELQKKVDAFFVVHYAGLKDKANNYITPQEAAKWYVTHINIPEASVQRGFIEEGMLCAADDSAYKQGFEAVVIAHDILAKGANPATYPPRITERGPFIVNKQRAKMLGIPLTKEMGIEEYIEEASVLKDLKK